MQVTPFGRIHPDWDLAPLPEVLFFQEGPGLRQWQWTETGMKVINGKNILLDGSIDTSNTERFISLDEFEERYRHFAIDVGDIVVTSSGTIGKVARIRAEHLPMMMNTSVIRFRSHDTEVVADEFAFAFLRSPLFAWQADVAATGAAQRNFGPVHLKQMQVPVPPLPVQRKIAAVLVAYDELIENNLRRIEILEEMAQAVYREWFVNFRFPGHEDVPLIDSPLGPIPEGWRVIGLDALVDNVRASTKAGPHLQDLPYVPIDCISARSVTLRDSKPGEEAKSGLILFDRGDILFGAMRPYFHKVALAPTKGVTRTTCFVLRPRIPSWRSFALMTMFRDETIAFASNHSRGSTIPYAAWDGSLAEMTIVRPHGGLVERFDEVVSPLFGLARNLIDQNANLRATRDLLLSKLVSGELDVSDLDIDTEWLAS